MPSIRLDCYSRRMRATRWAILGPGAISADFAQSLQQSEHGILHAVASSNAERAAHFARNHGVALSGSYESVLDRDDIDAVYIGTVHTTHAPLAIAALSAGKAVLCEKPISPTLDETLRVLKAARDAHVPFVEAFKYRFGPLAATLRDLIATGEIGDIQKLEAGFGRVAFSIRSLQVVPFWMLVPTRHRSRWASQPGHHTELANRAHGGYPLPPVKERSDRPVLTSGPRRRYRAVTSRRASAPRSLLTCLDRAPLWEHGARSKSLTSGGVGTRAQPNSS